MWCDIDCIPLRPFNHFARLAQTTGWLSRRRRRALSIKTPQPRTPPDDDKKRDLIGSMRQSIAAMEPCADRTVTEQRLAKYEAYNLLRFEGCGLPCSCNGRWGKWKERIIAGTCERFSDIRGA
ncbi:MAG: hypothetical protein KKE86_17040 [Planctomycetes bacterium]|nr:hypothetical protein [Planctomycetota bacterium]MBU4401022.1 hypothetical protein [Planctomycetota bacterium]MCG2684796.1 hypothetical protein [Planctomycetales bacterium]